MPIGDLQTIGTSFGFMGGIEYKLIKARTSINANFAVSRYSKESEILTNYTDPNFGTTLDEVTISVFSSIRFSTIGAHFEPFKGNPEVSPYVALGVGRTTYVTRWFIRDSSTLHGYADNERISTSITHHVAFGAGLRCALQRDGEYGRIDLTFQLMRYIGNRVDFMDPVTNPDHFNTDFREIDTMNKFQARSDFMTFWVGFQIRGGK